MKRIFLVLTLITIGCKNSTKNKKLEINIDEKNKIENVQPNEKIVETKIVEHRAIQFINSYVENCNLGKNAVDILEWSENNALSTKNFKSHLKKIIENNRLDFDPILDAQDYPEEGFELEKIIADTLIARGKNWKEFKIKMKIKQLEGLWFVEGIGVVNFGENEEIYLAESSALNDTLLIDLNGNGIAEKIFFTNTKECSELIITENDKILKFGCGNGKNLKFLSDVNWIDEWHIVEEKETYEVLFKTNGDILKDTIIKLEYPSLYIGKKEMGGGIITYRNDNLYWVHQAE